MEMFEISHHYKVRYNLKGCDDLEELFGGVRQSFGHFPRHKPLNSPRNVAMHAYSSSDHTIVSHNASKATKYYRTRTFR